MLAQYGRPVALPVRELPLAGFAEGVLDDAALTKAGRAMETEALRALTRDGRSSVRANAWKGLAAQGPLDEVWSLQAAVACKDDDADVRREAAQALRKCPASVLPQLQASIPSSIDLNVVMERTTTIRASLREAERTLSESRSELRRANLELQRAIRVMRLFLHRNRQ